MLTAITRDVSPEIAKCELTHIFREPIDVMKAIDQHMKYKEKLEDAGAKVFALAPLDGQPDAVFVEDTALVLPEIAIMTTMGAKSREDEVESIADELIRFRKLVHLQAPAKLEGGDVMAIGKKIYVGISTRTNHRAVMQLSRILKPFDYGVIPVTVTGCLHLKTGCTYVGSNKILVNRSWVDITNFGAHDILDVDSSERFGANSLLIGETLLYSAKFPATRTLLEKSGLQVEAIDISELEKAEAGLTCMSIIFDYS